TERYTLSLHDALPICLTAVLNGIAELNFSSFSDSKIDLFGDAYEYLINNYAATAGKSGGEFFTPQNVSNLIARLAMHRQEKVNRSEEHTSELQSRENL